MSSNSHSIQSPWSYTNLSFNIFTAMEDSAVFWRLFALLRWRMSFCCLISFFHSSTTCSLNRCVHYCFTHPVRHVMTEKRNAKHFIAPTMITNLYSNGRVKGHNTGTSRFHITITRCHIFPKPSKHYRY
jgi:hypothetical protein